ncbi:MAG: leucine-rich repeat domain-containing protein, partial [Planctomycetota bacterium]
MNELDDFETLTAFAGLPVEPFTGGTSLARTATHAYRIGVTWDDDDMEQEFHDRLDALLAAPEIGSLQGLVLGSWGESMNKFDPFMEKLLKNASSLTSLRAVFIGDIAQEEAEVSWIEQCDHGPLISALPQLEVYGVRGGNSLRFTGAKSPGLSKLIVQAGGLPSNAIGDIIAADFPALRNLELWLGCDEYGFDGSIDTVKQLIDGRAHPALSRLGLRNSEIVDAI